MYLVASNSTSWKRYGSVGRVVPCCQVRIDNPDRKGVGEVQVKGIMLCLAIIMMKKVQGFPLLKMVGLRLRFRLPG